MLLSHFLSIQALLKFFHIHLRKCKMILNQLTLSLPTQPGATALQLILKEGNIYVMHSLSLPTETQLII